MLLLTRMNGSSKEGIQPDRALESAFPGAPALALTFVTVGAAYAFPFLLFTQGHPLNGPISPEILNLNLLVAWMGLAHFVFAYSGQAKSFLPPRAPSLLPLFFLGQPWDCGCPPGAISKSGRIGPF